MSLADKRACIEPGHEDISIVRQCELVGLPRSSHYRRPVQPVEPAENLELMGLIDQEYTAHRD